MTNYYDVLGLDRAATEKDIKSAYRKLSTKFHPDKNQADPFFTQRYLAIQKAHEILGNERLRREYDKQLDSGAIDFEDPLSTGKHFEPIIERFEVSNLSTYYWEPVRVRWTVFNADHIRWEGIEISDTKNKSTDSGLLIRMNKEWHTIRIVATNMYLDKSVDLEARIYNQSFAQYSVEPYNAEKTSGIDSFSYKLLLFCLLTAQAAAWYSSGVPLVAWPPIWLGVVYFTLGAAMCMAGGERLQNAGKSQKLVWLLCIPFVNVLVSLFIASFSRERTGQEIMEGKPVKAWHSAAETFW